MYRLTLFLAVILLPIVVSSATKDTYGPIQSGELLWNIAAKVRLDPALSRYQVMFALLQTNPQAFDMTCNMNSLKVGQTLRIPSHMAILTPAEAREEFNRQNKAWKKYRRQGRPIDCPDLNESLIIEKPQTPVSPPMTTKTLTPLQPVSHQTSKPVDVASQSHLLSQQNQAITHEPSLMSITYWSDLWLWLSQQEFFIPIVVLFVLLIFSLVLWRSKDKTSNPSKTTSNPYLKVEDRLEKMPLPDNNANHHDESAETTHQTTTNASQPQIFDEMEEKLNHVRAYLAEDQEQVTQRLLREVVQKGSPEQQTEAKQLYEINKKMNFLKQHMTKDHPTLTAAQIQDSEYLHWQDLMQKSQSLYNPSYLSENKEKMFELVDKIFELLDDELNAQGKLKEAYRQKQGLFDSSDYEVVKKTHHAESHVGENAFGKPRQSPPSPRYL